MRYRILTASSPAHLERTVSDFLKKASRNTTCTWVPTGGPVSFLDNGQPQFHRERWAQALVRQEEKESA